MGLHLILKSKISIRSFSRSHCEPSSESIDKKQGNFESLLDKMLTKSQLIIEQEKGDDELEKLKNISLRLKQELIIDLVSRSETAE